MAGQVKGMDAPERYEIQVQGYLDGSWSASFDNLCIGHTETGTTILAGQLDQAALHGVLIKIRDLGLKLIAIRRDEPGKAQFPHV
jgi:hypothetical protein